MSIRPSKDQSPLSEKKEKTRKGPERVPTSDEQPIMPEPVMIDASQGRVLNDLDSRLLVPDSKTYAEMLPVACADVKSPAKPVVENESKRSTRSESRSKLPTIKGCQSSGKKGTKIKTKASRSSARRKYLRRKRRRRCCLRGKRRRRRNGRTEKEKQKEIAREKGKEKVSKEEAEWPPAGAPVAEKEKKQPKKMTKRLFTQKMVERSATKSGDELSNLMTVRSVCFSRGANSSRTVQSLDGE